MRKLASLFSLLSRVVLLAGFLGGTFAPAFAEDKPKTEISEAISDQLQALKALEDAGNKTDEAIALIDKLLAKAGPESYDRAVLSEFKANDLFKKNDHNGALEALQTALRLSDTYHYFDVREAQQTRFFVAYLTFERGSASKNPEDQIRDYNAAKDTIKKWLDVARTDPTFVPSTPDAIANSENFYASILYTLGAEVDPKHINKELVQQALDEVNKGMHDVVHPTESFYVTKLAALTQLQDYASAADVVEHLLKAKPQNPTYWQQLTSFYANLAGEAETKKDDRKSREYNIRAILAIERAQKYGAMNKQEDNMELFGFYYNIGQYPQAAELLESGMKNGKIQSTDKNWMILANTYQLLHKDEKAIEVLHQAAQLFPKKGEFNFVSSQVYYGMNKTAEALRDIQECVARGGGDKPAQSYLFMAYLAIELQKYELGGQAVESAAKAPHSPDDEKTITSLREAVKSAIEQRNAVGKPL